MFLLICGIQKTEANKLAKKKKVAKLSKTGNCDSYYWGWVSAAQNFSVVYSVKLYSCDLINH